MTPAPAAFEPGHLWDLLRTCTERAVAGGDLHSIETRHTLVEQSGVRFLVRVADNLRRKTEEARGNPGSPGGRPKDFNPYLPPEE